MKRFFVILLIAMSALIPVAADAEPQAKTPETEDGLPKKPVKLRGPVEEAVYNYSVKFGEKIDFGVPNLLLGWTKIFSEPVDQVRAKQGNDFTAGFVGLGKGLTYGILDTAGGLVNVGTSLYPYFTVPLPENGVDVTRMVGRNIPLEKEEERVEKMKLKKFKSEEGSL